METDHVVVEALEPRQFLSGTGPLVHRHLVPHFHQGDTIRQWRFPSHTIAPDVLVGHFGGYARDQISRHDPADLVLNKDAMGNLSGSLLMFNGFRFNSGFIAVLYSDGTFRLFARAISSDTTLIGTVNRSANGGVTLAGSFTVANAGNQVGSGLFRLTKL